MRAPNSAVLKVFELNDLIFTTVVFSKGVIEINNAFF